MFYGMRLGQIEVRRLRNYRLHSSKTKKNEIDNLPRRERKRIHTWDKQKKIQKLNGGRHNQEEKNRELGGGQRVLKLVYVHALAHVLSGRLLFLPLHSVVLPQSWQAFWQNARPPFPLHSLEPHLEQCRIRFESGDASVDSPVKG